MFYRDAGVAELADAQDLKSCGGDIVPVRSRSPAVRDFSLDYFVDKCIILVIDYVCVAQLDRALGYGPRCRGFESSHARLWKEYYILFVVFFFLPVWNLEI